MDEVEVELEQTIYSTVPGRIGNWSITRRVRLPAVPRGGDWVQRHEDGESWPVKNTTFVLDGPPVVTLEPVSTDDGRILDELDDLVDYRGWTRLGGPWVNQRSAS